MKSMEKKIIEKAVPAFLEKMMPNESQEYIAQLATILIANIFEYGYKNKELIINAKLDAFKAFLPIAERFLDNLNDMVKMSIELDDKHYSRIIQFVLENETVPFERKIEIYKELYEQKYKYIKLIACLLSVTIILTVLVKNYKSVVAIIAGIIVLIVKLLKENRKILKLIIKGIIKIIKIIFGR